MLLLAFTAGRAAPILDAVLEDRGVILHRACLNPAAAVDQIVARHVWHEPVVIEIERARGVRTPQMSKAIFVGVQFSAT